MDDLLILSLAVFHMLLSHLLAWPIRYYLTTRPALSQTIITRLNLCLVLAYNFHNSFISFGLILRTSHGPFSAGVATACLFFFGFFSLCLVGLHLALASVRYLTVTHFSWIQPQDSRKLASKIHLIVAGISVTLMAGIMPFRVPPNEVVGIESYLSGTAARKINRQWWQLSIGFGILLAAVSLYFFSNWIIQKRAMAMHVEPLDNPAPSGWQMKSLARYIDVKTLVLGSFYTLGCYILAALLDFVPAFQKGVSLLLALLHVNNCVLFFLSSRPKVRACSWGKMKQVACWCWHRQEQGGTRCQGWRQR